MAFQIGGMVFLLSGATLMLLNVVHLTGLI